jgi:uncharacterized protein (DUF1330 family)
MNSATLPLSLPPQKIRRQGRILYDEQLKSLLEKEHSGKYLVLDVETQDYVVTEEYVSTLIEMQEKHGGCLQYVVRIGDETLMRMGRRP